MAKTVCKSSLLALLLGACAENSEVPSAVPPANGVVQHPTPLGSQPIVAGEVLMHFGIAAEVPVVRRQLAIHGLSLLGWSARAGLARVRVPANETVEHAIAGALDTGLLVERAPPSRGNTVPKTYAFVTVLLASTEFGRRAVGVVEVRARRRPLANARLSMAWSGSHRGRAWCVTDDFGRCVIESPIVDVRHDDEPILFGLEVHRARHADGRTVPVRESYRAHRPRQRLLADAGASAAMVVFHQDAAQLGPSSILHPYNLLEGFHIRNVLPGGPARNSFVFNAALFAQIEASLPRVHLVEGGLATLTQQSEQAVLHINDVPAAVGDAVPQRLAGRTRFMRLRGSVAEYEEENGITLTEAEIVSGSGLFGSGMSPFWLLRLDFFGPSTPF
jgi:hypothetical protein